ncbi:MAG TPA: hypothetical protein PKN47_23115 [Nitrospira sp.]|nr:hypothetical protein [Nitrospira sp.]
MDITDETISWLEKLTGQKVPLPEKQSDLFPREAFSKGGIGYSQFNEMLLSLGYDRITRDFFDYLFADGNQASQGQSTPHISTFEDYKRGIERFRSQSLLLFGNVKYGFKRLSCLDKTSIERELTRILPIPQEVFRQRHKPLHTLSRIGAEDTYYLGYLVYNEIKRELDLAPESEDLKAKHQMILEIRKKGRRNHDIYLTYDHMDVYVATSMRERHEYFLVNRFIQNLFSAPNLTPLNLRFFDPTQAYCEDRLDKGLVEGLMLKRAKCTIYHAQETDTLGKDSELATTLAQGKPVIAYVPKLRDRDEFLSSAIALSDHLYPGLPRETHLAKLLRLYDPDSAWSNAKIREWLSGTKSSDEQEICELIFEKAQAKYESRARMLSRDHPLGLQMNLATGVANGVMVVRSVSQCAELLLTCPL